MYKTYAMRAVDFSKINKYMSVSSLAGTVPLPGDYVNY